MARTSRPNVLLLFSDQHNARVAGCYGNREVHTPNLDRLATEGVRFAEAYANNPICTPSRMCYMSGQYVHNHGRYGLMGKPPVDLPNAFSFFRGHGYTTGMAGKFHTPAGWLAKDCDFVADAFGYETPLRRWEDGMLEGLQGRFDDHYSLDLARRGLLGERDDRTLHEQREHFGLWKGQGVDARPSRLGEDETVEAWTAGKTVEFLSEAKSKNAPFFFWMTVPRPHQTYAPARRFWDMYDESQITLPPSAGDSMDGRHRSARRTQEYFHNNDEWRLYDPKDWDSTRRRVLHGYYASVTQVDDSVGRVLVALERLGLRENTIVVYASDHGEFAGEHGMIEKAPGIAFRCVTRVPWIWSFPGVLPQGAVRDSLVESVDFLPTVASLCGLPQPNWVDGKDTTQLLQEGGDLRDAAVTENVLTKTIHTHRYKLTQYQPEMCDGEDFGELYDLEKDPWELRNLYFEAEAREIVHDLRHRLYNWLVRTTRYVTVNTIPGNLPGKSFKAWDLADSLYDGDGRLGIGYLRELIEREEENYL